MLLWIIIAGLTAFVLFVLLRPLAATSKAERAPEDFDAAIYRDQLKEIESDRARGLLGEEEAEAARTEIARRLLAADSSAKQSRNAQTGSAATRSALAGVAVALPLLAVSLYLLYGSPRLPDQPLAARLKDPANDQNLAALVAKVEARLRQHPQEGEGWDVIAPVYLSWQRYSEAADAYEQAITLLGESAKRLSGQGQALVLANNGVVTEEARRALERALELDATLIEPRILLAIAKEQDGRFAEAIDEWRALLPRADAKAPWRAMVETRIAAAEARLAGRPPAEAPAESQGGAPSAGDIAAVEKMSPAERRATIEGMVRRLADRLDQDGNDLPGWLQLVRAYSVLDRKDDAQKALERAKTQFSGDTKALQQLDALAAELGLES